LPEISFNEAQASPAHNEEVKLNLPKAFWGSSLVKTENNINKNTSNESSANMSPDFAGGLLDEVKTCFGEGAIMQASKAKGDMGQFISGLENDLGPAREDILLEKKATLTMKDGKTRNLVYEWISPEEGSDLYWHETDEEGFPRPVDLPENIEHDLATFDQLKNQGTVAKLTETRLMQLNHDIQIGIEKSNDVIESLSVKDEGHLVKCRRDPVKNYVCDCLN